MIGIRGSLEILKVTRNAGGRSQVVVVVDVTVGASPGRNSVRAREREVDAAVVEVGRSPACRRVAGFTGLRESTGNVVGIRGSLEILEVTADASRVGAGQGVIAIHVALGTLV